MDDPAYLILHGLAGNGPGHWQTRLAERLTHRDGLVRYPVLADFDNPKLDAWLACLGRELGQLAGRSTVVVCHSLAVMLWLHHASRSEGMQVERAILVAPPSPNLGMEEQADFFPVALHAKAVRRAAGQTILVCADDDAYCPEGAKQLYGDPLGIETIVINGGGHLNEDAGFGEWPAMEEWVVGRL